MPRYLAPKASGNCAVAICPRCHFKVYYTELVRDGAIPGLFVCVKCKDGNDPYRLPARKTERITLQHPRPDDAIEVPVEPLQLIA